MIGVDSVQIYFVINNQAIVERTPAQVMHLFAIFLLDMQSQIFVRFFSTNIALTPTDTGKLSYFEESSQVIVKDS